jgi:hypothetical protein
MKQDNKLIDLTLWIHNWPISGLSVGVKEYDETDEDVIFLPLSQIELEVASPYRGVATITMPEWLAREKELI